MNNTNNNDSTTNLTIPTTISALLTEENTIDPLSHLPSFLELTFVDVARNSGRKALSASWGVMTHWLDEGVLQWLDRKIESSRGRIVRSTTTTTTTTTSCNNILYSAPLINLMARIQTYIYTKLRHKIHSLLKTIQSFAPELQTLLMFAIDYHCVHYLAGSTACEMVYGLKRSKIVKNKAFPQVAAAAAAESTATLSTNDTNGMHNGIHMQQQQHHQHQQQQEQQEYRVVELNQGNKTTSALLAALLPYWKEKCDEIYKKWMVTNNDSLANVQSFNSSGNDSGNGSSQRWHNNNNNNNNNINNSRSILNQQQQQTLKQAFLNLYPYLHMTHEGSIFLYQFAYLLGYTPYWSFSLHALRVMLRRMTVADVQQQQQQQQQQSKKMQNSHSRKVNATSSSKSLQKSSMSNSSTDKSHPTNAQSLHNNSSAIAKATRNNSLSTMSNIMTAPNVLRGAILFSISYTVLSGWYSHFQRELRLRRRRWIAGDGNGGGESIGTGREDNLQTTRRGQRNGGVGEQHHDRSHATTATLPIPPPPLPPPKLSMNDSDNNNNNNNNNNTTNNHETIDKWSCPLCHEPRINPTASTSGYVFCYKCLIMHLRHTGEYCPVTGMPCWESRVVRLYEPTASSSR